jgi:AraC-like DNA-binding protein
MQRAVVACYREFAPCEALRPYVRTFFSFGPEAEMRPAPRRITQRVLFGAGAKFCSPLFAHGQSSMVFDLGIACHADGSWQPNRGGPRGSIIGAISRVDPVCGVERPEMVGVYLQPAQVSPLAHVPAWELTDRIVPLEDLWGSAAADLPVHLGEIAERDRIDHLESVLLRRIQYPRGESGTVKVPGLASWVLHDRGQMSVERLAEAAGVSRQRLGRIFHACVGLSPKLYCRLARFQSALAYAGRGKNVVWAQAALEMGYADQSHMIAEFREFSSLTPQKLATGRWFHPFIERAGRRYGNDLPSLIPAPLSKRSG